MQAAHPTRQEAALIVAFQHIARASTLLERQWSGCSRAGPSWELSTQRAVERQSVSCHVNTVGVKLDAFENVNRPGASCACQYRAHKPASHLV